MSNLNDFITDLGNEALEQDTRIAGLAVISDNGELISQTSNLDLSGQTEVILEVVNGAPSFTVNDTKFTVVETSSDGTVGTNEQGMGHLIVVPFRGGFLVSYAMPQADPSKALSFLQSRVMGLEGLF